MITREKRIESCRWFIYTSLHKSLKSFAFSKLKLCSTLKTFFCSISTVEINKNQGTKIKEMNKTWRTSLLTDTIANQIFLSYLLLMKPYRICW